MYYIKPSGCNAPPSWNVRQPPTPNSPRSHLRGLHPPHAQTDLPERTGAGAADGGQDDADGAGARAGVMVVAGCQAECQGQRDRQQYFEVHGPLLIQYVQRSEPPSRRRCAPSLVIAQLCAWGVARFWPGWGKIGGGRHATGDGTGPATFPFQWIRRREWRYSGGRVRLPTDHKRGETVQRTPTHP